MDGSSFLDVKVNSRLQTLVQQEQIRQRNCIDLIASENFCSPAVLKLLGTTLTNKYAEGYPHHRYYEGCQVVDQIEELAQDRVRSLFACRCSSDNQKCRRANDYVNVQPASGSDANAAVYCALLEPGQTLLSLSLKAGGHLTHGSKVSFSGRYFKAVHYGLDPKTMRLDYQAIEQLAVRYRPKIIIAGFSAYAFRIDWHRFRMIADRVGAWLWCDIAHIAGLVAAGQHPSPVCDADVITFTTHKTLRGPRGGVIMATAQLANRIAKGLFPGVQGGPHNNIIAAKAQAFQEAVRPQFKSYQQQIVRNCRAMCQKFIDRGFAPVGGLSENHLFLLNTVNSPAGLTGLVASRRLAQINIISNKNAMPDDQLSPKITSGIRFGSAPMTSRNWTEIHFQQLAEIIIRVWMMKETDFKRSISNLQIEVAELLTTAKTTFYPSHSLLS